MTSKPTVSALTTAPEPVVHRKQVAPDRSTPNPAAADRPATDDARSNPTSTGSGGPEPRHEATRSRWGWLITVLILGGITAGAWYYRASWLPQMTTLLKGSQTPVKPPPRPVPVGIAVVTKRNMNIYLNGLGTVTALQTVTIRSRVEGEIVNVNFSEGQMVHEGQLLAEIDTRPFEIQKAQAVGALERDKAALEIAKLNLVRLNRLITSTAVNQQQVDEQTALVKQTEGAIKAGQATVEAAELQLTYCKITSPIKGRIGLRLVDVGNIVRANDSNGLAVITRLAPINLVFTVPQDDIPRIQKRMQDGHALEVEAYDRDFKTKLATGSLTAIDNQVDPTTGTLKLKASFENTDNVLFPNQFVNTRLLVDTIKNALVVPSAAIQRGPEYTFVYIVKPDETVDLRKVTVGPAEGGVTVIQSGLEIDEIVVTEGLDKLQPPNEKQKTGTKITYRKKDEKAGAERKDGGKAESSNAGGPNEGKGTGESRTPSSEKTSDKDNVAPSSNATPMKATSGDTQSADPSAAGPSRLPAGTSQSDRTKDAR